MVAVGIAVGHAGLASVRSPGAVAAQDGSAGGQGVSEGHAPHEKLVVGSAGLTSRPPLRRSQTVRRPTGPLSATETHSLVIDAAQTRGPSGPTDCRTNPPVTTMPALPCETTRATTRFAQRGPR